MKTKRMSTETLTLGAVLTALVVILQFLAKISAPFLPVTLSFVLIPIVIGAAKCGPYMGGWLGFVFAIAVFITGGATEFFPINEIGTVLTVVIKGVACGFASGFTYYWLKNKNQLIAVYAAAVVCPFVNTGVFLLGCRLFFMELMEIWANNMGFGDNVVACMFLGIAGINFLVELGLNIVLAPVIIRALKMKGSQL